MVGSKQISHFMWENKQPFVWFLMNTSEKKNIVTVLNMTVTIDSYADLKHSVLEGFFVCIC